MELFEPYKNFQYEPHRCFLCGNHAQGKEYSVFPDWFLGEFGLVGQPFRMLNESYKNYEALRVPCCEDCQSLRIGPLEAKVEDAFKQGYTGMAFLDSDDLFLWVSRILYGIIHVETSLALEDHEKENRGSAETSPMGMSPSLITKFSQVHLFLQGLVVPMVLEDFTPYSYWLVPIKPDTNSNTRSETFSVPFEYRDDMSTLIFSLTALDFGLIICLQDNGMNKIYQKPFLSPFENVPLTYKQFQEMRARIFYSAFLFIPIPEYLVLPPVASQLEYTVSAQPLPFSGPALFKPWVNKTYAQVLEAFWKPWGISKASILDEPDHPLSELGL